MVDIKRKYNISLLSPIDILFLILLVDKTLWKYFTIILSNLSLGGVSFEIFEPIIIISLVVLSLPKFFKILDISDVLFYVICVLIFFTHYILFIKNNMYMDEILIKFPLFVLSYYFIGRTIDYEKNSNIVTILSILSILTYSFSYFFFHDISEDVRRGGNMDGAFTLLPFILLVLLDSFKTKNIISIGVSIYSFFLLLSFGNRGGLLYAIIYLLILLYQKLKINPSKRRIGMMILFGILMVCFGIFYDYIFKSVYSFLDQKEMSLRILDKILMGELGESSGRNIIINNILNTLSKNFLGLGICGDRLLLGGVYAHNLFIEIFAIFGYVIGAVFIFLFLRLIYRAYIHLVNTEIHSFYIAMICFGCLPLMTSGSFLEYPFFFLLLGYSVKVIKDDRKCIG